MLAIAKFLVVSNFHAFLNPFPLVQLYDNSTVSSTHYMIDIITCSVTVTNSRVECTA